jgi:hypothetical protein
LARCLLLVAAAAAAEAQRDCRQHHQTRRLVVLAVVCSFAAAASQTRCLTALLPLRCLQTVLALGQSHGLLLPLPPLGLYAAWLV